MLTLLNSFVLRSAVRTPLHMLSPKVLSISEITLPKNSNIHLLETNNDSLFLHRHHTYFKDIPKNKKIPVYHITDLIVKDGVKNLQNKYLVRDIRKWNVSNIKEFKAVNLLETPNSDPNVIGVFNYNTLKNLYFYTSSLLSLHFEFSNLYTTYFYYVSKAIEADSTTTQFLKFSLPHSIPSHFILNKIIEFNAIKYTRIIKDNNLKVLLEIYKWLSDETRNKSLLTNITDEQSRSIMIEFEYRNYYCYLPLHVIRSVHEKSKLESRLKLKSEKVQKLFISFLHRFIDEVNKLYEKDEHTVLEVSELKKSDSSSFTENEEEEINEPNEIDSNFKVSKFLSSSNVNRNLENMNKDIDLDIDMDVSPNSLLIQLNKTEIDNSEIDDLYLEDVTKLDKETDEEVEKEQKITIDYSKENIEKVLLPEKLEDKVNKYIEEAKEVKSLSATEIRSLRKIEENRHTLKNPYDNKTLLNDSLNTTEATKPFTENQIRIYTTNDHIRTDIAQDSIKTFDKSYIENTLRKDIVNSVIAIEKTGIIIKEYEIEVVKNAIDNYERHRVVLKPLHGKESTIYFRVPIIDSEGRFIASGVKNIMRKQRTDLPIRKINSIKVGLTSNYCKLFVSRTERKAFDPYDYIVNNIKNDYLEGKPHLKTLVLGNAFISNRKLPNLYSYLSKHFLSIELQDYTLHFDLNEVTKLVDEKVALDIEKQNLVFIGYVNKSKEILVLNSNEEVLIYSNTLKLIDRLENILHVNTEKLPVSFTTIKILGKDIPLGPAISFYTGLSNLLAISGTQVEIFASNERIDFKPNSFLLRFKDVKVRIDKSQIEGSLLLSGFMFFKDFIKNYNFNDFNDKNIYLLMFETREFNLIYLKELDLLRDLFLDPITISVLQEIKEPDTFIPLLLRANELLADFSHPDINDPTYARIRGYDRIPGLTYRVLVESVRAYKFKYSAKSKVDLDPYKVWNTITSDNTVKITEDINPIMDLKETESMTLIGIDGLNRDSVPSGLREFHKNDIGLVSEASVDNSDVGLNTYLTPFAKLQNTRGTVDISNIQHKQNKSKVLSTSSLLSPHILHDDSKRINFVNIQNSHVIATEGYQQPILRTEYEYILPYRVSSYFCVIAEEDGFVSNLTDKNMQVTYKTLGVKGYKIGNVFGRAEGTVYLHKIVTDLQKGSKFKKGDYLLYNSNFFEKDWLHMNTLITKFNRTITTALALTNNCYEDSSAISSKLSEQMTTTLTKERSFIIEFGKNIVNLLPIGKHVEPNDVLFMLLDEHTDYTNLSENTVSLLKSLTNIAPKAKLKGIIERYEVRYNGDINDMSPTLKKLVKEIDKDTYERSQGTDYEIRNGKVSSEYRVEGKNLLLDTLELRVYLTVNLSMGIGDKGVYSTQLKSIISDVYTHNVTTDSGDEVEAFFGFKSILNRITLSPLVTGILNRIFRKLSIKVADIYFNK